MGDYINQSDILKRVKGEQPLKRITRASGNLDVDFITTAITDAEDAINEFAKDTQGFPWTTVPSKAVGVAVDIAIYYLQTRAWPGSPIPLAIAEAYRQAKLSLQELRDGDSNWVEGVSPAKQNVSKVFVSLPGDEPQTFPDARQARYGRLKKIF